jgi:hypothetical protein
MRKQTDFVVRVWELGNGSNGSTTGQALSHEVKELYLNNGFEVFSTAALQVSAGVIYYNMSFVKYEDVPEQVKENVSKPK